MSIASKNLYELLGNDADQDPDLREPEPPTKAIDKTAARTGKRNAPAEAPARSAPSTGGRQRDTRDANENAFRDRGVGHDRNKARGTGDRGEIDGRTRGRGDGRGRGRGRGSGGAGGDRHSRTGIAEHEKQVAHGWGGETGNAELADEQGGAADAQKDEKAAAVEDANADASAEPEADPEPEDKTKSYTAYLAELAEKKLSLGTPEVRKANEGSSKKFPEGKAIARDESEDFIAGTGGKAKRERQRKEKTLVELDDSRLHASGRENIRGGRGGRGRGEGRGRGRGEGRGRGGGEFRGDRSEYRGRGRGGPSGPNISDSSAFPSLGGA